MNTCIFLTTRYGSSRFPKKHLQPIGKDTNVTDILIERLKLTGMPIIMTTPNTPDDIKYMHPIAKKHGIQYFAGNIENIIQRHLDCATANDIDWIINVDGDDILTCPDLVDIVFKAIKDDLGHNCVKLSNYPLGLNLMAYTPKLLESVAYKKDTNWGAKIYDKGRVLEIEGELFNDCRLTLDYIEDLIVIKHLIIALGVESSSADICYYMKEHPELRAINNYRNTEYYQRLEDLSK